MQIPLIYLISLVSTLGVLCLWKAFRLVDAPTRRLIFSFLRKKLLYPLVFQRQKSTSNINVFAFLRILLVIAANITACTLKISDRTELAKRCGTLFMINVVPLYLGGRTSLLVDRVLRLPLSEYSLIHRWMGRICVIQGLVHGVINASLSSPSIIEALLLSFLTSIGLLSFIYIRRYMYEVFLKSHLVFSLALAGSLWFHIRLAKNITVMSLGIASALWLTHHIAWLIRLIYRNFSSEGFTEKVTFVPLNDNGLSQATRATITLTRPWKVVAGQYIYLTLPTEARHRLGLFQSHPYLIAWVDESRREITLLIQKSDGFSNAAFSVQKPESSALVDGPYGHSLSLDGYDKVLFVASGVGISAHLLAMKHLLEAHHTQSARIRRLTLVWFLETPDQEEWAMEFIRILLTMESSEIFTLTIYVPALTPGPEFIANTEKRGKRTDQSLDLHEYIQGEAKVEAGNMAISVCGTPSFEQAVRRGVLASDQDIYLFTNGFYPEETRASRKSNGRLVMRSSS